MSSSCKPPLIPGTPLSSSLINKHGCICRWVGIASEVSYKEVPRGSIVRATRQKIGHFDVKSLAIVMCNDDPPMRGSHERDKHNLKENKVSNKGYKSRSERASLGKELCTGMIRCFSKPLSMRRVAIAAIMVRISEQSKSFGSP